MNTKNQELLDRIKTVVPPEAEVVAHDWQYEHEDYNIEIIVPDTMTENEIHTMKDHTAEVVVDWMDDHQEFMLCLVSRQYERTSMLASS